MKLVIDERVKHRLIGLAVVLSLAAIFAPAIMKKSNHHLDSNIGISVHLPPKPVLPKVAVMDENKMFQTVKVAHVELPKPPQPPKESSLAKAESLTELNHLKAVAPMIAKAGSQQVIKPMLAALTQPKPAMTLAKSTTKPALKAATIVKHPNAKKTPFAKLVKVNTAKKRNGYAVQLATFAQQRNADLLVNKLRGKGYQASYNKIRLNGSTVYKVLVGQAAQRHEAQSLQKQLANVMQIKGFIVPTEIS